MTSAERREGRYQRRKEARYRKRMEKAPCADDYAAVFSFGNLWGSYHNCRKNVAWKGSVQRYILASPIRVKKTHLELMAKKYKCVVPNEWDTMERGALRHIKSVPIGERVMQRSLADNALLPVLAPTYIYDNGACMKYKGYDFAMRRLVCHLSRHYRKHGTDGYILMFDFKKFYESIPHALIERIIHSKYSDEWIRLMIKKVMNTFGDVGLGLGSQISQVLALASGSPMDHAIKEVMRISNYARYNDDGYLIHVSKEHLKNCLAHMREICHELGITINEKKTKIVKLTHGFKFLKARIYLTPTGKIVRKISKRSIVCERRKLKKLYKRLQDGLIDMPHIEMQYQSWRSFALKFDAWKTVQSMDALYHRIYVLKEAV